MHVMHSGQIVLGFIDDKVNLAYLRGSAERI